MVYQIQKKREQFSTCTRQAMQYFQWIFILIRVYIEKNTTSSKQELDYAIVPTNPFSRNRLEEKPILFSLVQRENENQFLLPLLPTPRVEWPEVADP